MVPIVSGSEIQGIRITYLVCSSPAVRWNKFSMEPHDTDDCSPAFSCLTKYATMIVIVTVSTLHGDYCEEDHIDNEDDQ